jgi:hypothetical protein
MPPNTNAVARAAAALAANPQLKNDRPVDAGRARIANPAIVAQDKAAELLREQLARRRGRARDYGEEARVETVRGDGQGRSSQRRS